MVDKNGINQKIFALGWLDAAKYLNFNQERKEPNLVYGTTKTFNLECVANHIQLNIGDRVRYYLSTDIYRKL
ncbi:MAG TPA: hypothetical protein GXX36_02510 [Clostridiaceae bacterium]|nr:hypothetical protein [Clostridiaceae bacterium]